MIIELQQNMPHIDGFKKIIDHIILTETWP